MIRPGVSIAVIAAAVAIPVLSHTFSSAQAPSGRTCATTPTQPALLSGSFPQQVHGSQRQVLIWQHSTQFDLYLQSLAPAAPPAAGSDPKTFGSRAMQHFQDVQKVQRFLPDLLNSAYGIGLASTKDQFDCFGLGAGEWTLLGVEKSTVPSPTPQPKQLDPLALANAAMHTNASGVTYYYSSVTVKPSDLQFVPQSDADKKNHVPPHYPVVNPKQFRPIANYPTGYFVR